MSAVRHLSAPGPASVAAHQRAADQRRPAQRRFEPPGPSAIRPASLARPDSPARTRRTRPARTRPARLRAARPPTARAPPPGVGRHGQLGQLGHQHGHVRAAGGRRPWSNRARAIARCHGESIATCTLGATPCSAANAHTRGQCVRHRHAGSPHHQRRVGPPGEPAAARSRHWPSGPLHHRGQAVRADPLQSGHAAQDGRLGIGGGISRTATTASRPPAPPRAGCAPAPPLGPSSASSPTASVSSAVAVHRGQPVSQRDAAPHQCAKPVRAPLGVPTPDNCLTGGVGRRGKRSPKTGRITSGDVIRPLSGQPSLRAAKLSRHTGA